MRSVENNTNYDSIEWRTADPVTGTIGKFGYATYGNGFTTEETEPLGQTLFQSDSADIPEPPVNDSGINRADDPHWQCTAGAQFYGGFTGMPFHCQLKALLNAGDKLPWEEASPNHQPSSAPGREHQPNYARQDEMPVNPTSTEKPPAETAVGNIIPAAYEPDSDNAGDIILATVEVPISFDNEIPDFVDASLNDWEIIPLPDNFKELLKARLNSGDCNAFMSKVFAKVIENTNREIDERNKILGPNWFRYVKAEVKDGLDLLEQISSFVLVPNLKVGGWIAQGTVSGSIKEGNAVVKLFPAYDTKIKGYDAKKNATASYIMTALHEIAHLAGNVFDDEALAKAVSDLGENTTALPNESEDEMIKIGKYGNIWSQALLKHCGGK